MAISMGVKRIDRPDEKPLGIEFFLPPYRYDGLTYRWGRQSPWSCIDVSSFSLVLWPSQTLPYRCELLPYRYGPLVLLSVSMRFHRMDVHVLDALGTNKLHIPYRWVVCTVSIRWVKVLIVVSIPSLHLDVWAPSSSNVSIRWNHRIDTVGRIDERIDPFSPYGCMHSGLLGTELAYRSGLPPYRYGCLFLGIFLHCFEAVSMGYGDVSIQFDQKTHFQAVFQHVIFEG